MFALVKGKEDGKGKFYGGSGDAVPFLMFAYLRNDDNDTKTVPDGGYLYRRTETTTGTGTYFCRLDPIGSSGRRNFLGGKDAGRI